MESLFVINGKTVDEKKMPTTESVYCQNDVGNCNKTYVKIRQNKNKRKTDAFQLKSALDAVNWSVSDCNPGGKKAVRIDMNMKTRQWGKMNIYRAVLKFTWSMSLVSKQKSCHVFRLCDHKPMHFPCCNRKKDTHITRVCAKCFVHQVVYTLAHIGCFAYATFKWSSYKLNIVDITPA